MSVENCSKGQAKRLAGRTARVKGRKWHMVPIHEEHYRRLLAVATREGVSVAHIVRRAVDGCLAAAERGG